MICPSVVYPEGAKLARVWYGAGIFLSSESSEGYVYDESGRISKVLHPLNTEDGEGNLLATLNMFMTSGVFCLKKFTSTET